MMTEDDYDDDNYYDKNETGTFDFAFIDADKVRDDFKRGAYRIFSPNSCSLLMTCIII